MKRHRGCETVREGRYLLDIPCGCQVIIKGSDFQVHRIEGEPCAKRPRPEKHAAAAAEEVALVTPLAQIPPQFVDEPSQWTVWAPDAMAPASPSLEPAAEPDASPWHRAPHRRTQEMKLKEEEEATVAKEMKKAKKAMKKAKQAMNEKEYAVEKKERKENRKKRKTKTTTGTIHQPIDLIDPPIPPLGPSVDQVWSLLLDPKKLWERWPADCNTRNAHVRDKLIKFDDSWDATKKEAKHDYIVLDTEKEEINPGVSATGILERYWPHFDGEETSRRLLRQNDTRRQAEKDDGKKRPSTSRYAEMTEASEFAKQWKFDQDFGTARHAVFEAYGLRSPAFETWDWCPKRVRYVLGNCKDTWEFLPLGYVRWWASHPTFVPYRIEWSILLRDSRGNPKYGQPDLTVFDSATNRLHVVDFKNCRGFMKKESPSKIGTHPRTWRQVASKPTAYGTQTNTYYTILDAAYELPYEFGPSILVNIPPDADKSDEFEEVFVPLERYAGPGGVFEDFPWNDADPRHRYFPLQLPPGIPLIHFDDPRVLQGGPTQCGFYIKHVLNHDGSFPADGMVVWTGGAYDKEQFHFPKSPFASDLHIFGKWSWAQMAVYEETLLSEAKRDVLARVKPELYGKVLACWCFPTGDCRCQARVLVKWANLLGQDLVQLPLAANDIRAWAKATLS